MFEDSVQTVCLQQLNDFTWPRLTEIFRNAIEQIFKQFTWRPAVMKRGITEIEKVPTASGVLYHCNMLVWHTEKC